MTTAWLLLHLASCVPWIGASEHQRNQRSPLVTADTDTDADADADADADTDTDTDTDTDSGTVSTETADTGAPPCMDDDREPDGLISEATDLTTAAMPTRLDGVLCTDDRGADGYIRDRFEVRLLVDELLSIQTEAHDALSCAEQHVLIEVTSRDPSDVVASAISDGVSCAGLVTAPGPGSWIVTLRSLAPERRQPYVLAIDQPRCSDSDGDGFPARSCGGSDCDDEDASVHPDALEEPGDGVDQDCSGFDELATCEVLGDRSEYVVEDLVCGGDFGSTWWWDIWELEVEAGDCIDITADNETDTRADLLALAIDASGSATFGVSADFDQLEDERACTTPAWNDYQCPSRALVAQRSGRLEIRVAQWVGPGVIPGVDTCYDRAGYRLYTARNGVPARPILRLDDTDLGWPP